MFFLILTPLEREFELREKKLEWKKIEYVFREGRKLRKNIK